MSARETLASLPDAGRAVLDWLDRAGRLVPPEDRKVLLSPPRLARAFARWALFHRGDHLDTTDLGARDPELCALLLDLFRTLGSVYFRVQVTGVENVPASGPVLLCGNHNGGIVSLDSFFASGAIMEAHGLSRAPYALGHDVLFDDPVTRRYAARLGILRAGHDSARRALREGHSVLVYPGSDWDAFRPYTDRNKVVLAGRKGFLRLALREQVPIVPVVSAGSHAQFIVITRGDRLGRLIGVHRFARTDVLPIVFSLPWGITSGFLPYLPLPTQITVGFGEPIRWPDLGPAAADDPEILARCYAEVEGQMQALLDRLVARRASKSG
jgi:1-acyl-sn-glycerol-3-phosphate acyltransferase